MEGLGANTKTLKEVYILFIRSILEYCAPLWAGNLSVKSIKALTRVEKNALKIIFPSLSYEEAVLSLNIQNLSQRRLTLTKKCAQKMAESKRFENCFVKKSGSVTRSNSQYVIPQTKRNRSKYAPYSVFSKLLNGQEENVFRNM